MGERGPKGDRPDALADFPEEFEQRPDGPARDLARRARTDASGDAAEPPEPGSALARIEAVKRRLRELADE